MAYKQYCSSLSTRALHLSQTFLLELRIPHRQHFIHDKYLRLQMRSHRKSKANIHTAGIALDRGVEKSFHFGKGDNFIKFTFNLGLAHAQDRAIEIDVLAPSQLGMKAGADFQQTRHPPIDFDAS